MKQGAWLSIYKIHGDCVSIYTHMFTKTTESNTQDTNKLTSRFSLDV
jgi:hypothetical protein